MNSHGAGGEGEAFYLLSGEEEDFFLKKRRGG